MQKVYMNMSTHARTLGRGVEEAEEAEAEEAEEEAEEEEAEEEEEIEARSK